MTEWTVHVRVFKSLPVSVLRTDLAAGAPQRHGAVVGGVGPGAGWIYATQLLHVVMDVGISCRGSMEEELFTDFFYIITDTLLHYVPFILKQVPL